MKFHPYTSLGACLLAFGHLALAAEGRAVDNDSAVAESVPASPPPPPIAADAQMATVLVTAARPDLIGIAATSSQGIVNRHELELRPVYRVGQLLETIPGLVVTAHSGEGKANQYLLRGFNLDHGTDLATYIDGMPVNGRTHTHGQGYTDVNFMIPELAGGVEFTKGPYFAGEGDFSSVGTARIKYVDRIDNQLSVAVGTVGDQRVFGAATRPFGAGRLLAAAELVRLDGPWDHPDDVHKLNAVLRYSEGVAADGFALTAMAYRNRWNATTDQPARAVAQGLVSRFGSLDPSDGGRAERYSLSGRYAAAWDDWQLKASAYAIHSRLTLWNDFTHLLDDPVNGDQHGQNDRRSIVGGEVSLARVGQLFGVYSTSTIGVQTRNDAIDVDLQHTQRRAVLSTDRANHVRENSIGIHAENTTHWTPWLRSIAGVREDYFRTRDTDLAIPANSGTQGQALFQPKLSVVIGPFAKTELYLSAGRGFHSNDARSGVDDTGNAYLRPPLLVKSVGSEIGVRSTWIPNLQLSATLFQINFDSELIYNGDAGATEAGRPSHRRGVELTGQYRPRPWLAINANLAFARARFTDADPAGNYVEDAPDFVASAGILVDNLGPWSGALTLRNLGPHPLNNDNSVRSKGYSELNAALGYKISPTLKISVDIFNLLDAKTNAADYFYTSRLAGEPAEGVEDRHAHPLEPRSLRVTLSKRF